VVAGKEKDSPGFIDTATQATGSRTLCPFGSQILFGRNGIKGRRLSLLNSQGPGGTYVQANAGTITQFLPQNPGLTVNNLNGSLGAGRYAQAAAGAFLFVYTDNLAFHKITFLEDLDFYQAALLTYILSPLSKAHCDALPRLL
jgi:hypothetical protein